MKPGAEHNLRVGLIGAGNWAGTAHRPAFAAQANVNVVGITDTNPEHIRAFSEKFGIPGCPNLGQRLYFSVGDPFNPLPVSGMTMVSSGCARGWICFRAAIAVALVGSM
jgi:hypothetical protein